MRARLFLLLLALLATSPATAATGCDFAYDASIRDGLVRPALVSLAATGGLRSDFAAYFNLDKPFIHPTGRADGTLILTFDADVPDLDGPTLRMVIDPCSRRVVYANARQDNVMILPDVDRFTTDDATLKKALVGSWIVPPESWLLKPDDPATEPDINLRIVQSFQDGGGGLTQLYKDGACTVPDRSAAFTWRVSGGVLTIAPAKNDGDAFLLLAPRPIAIAPIKPNQLAFFSQDRKSYGLLNRAPRCGWPDNLEQRIY